MAHEGGGGSNNPKNSPHSLWTTPRIRSPIFFTDFLETGKKIRTKSFSVFVRKGTLNSPAEMLIRKIEKK